jgi:hypothetical protein
MSHRFMILRYLVLSLFCTSILSGMFTLPPGALGFAGFKKKNSLTQSESLTFVPAFVSPNGLLDVETGKPGALSEAGALRPGETNAYYGHHQQEGDLEAVRLEGVTPNQTLEALRRYPQPNAALLNSVSVKQTLLPAGAKGQTSVSSQAAKTSTHQPALEAMTQLQQTVSEEDLKRLWSATIDRNPVVRFALEKISLPAERHFSHSSEFMRKSLSVLVSGAAMASTLVAPTSGYQNMTVMTGSQIAQNYLTGRNKPISDLSPTEHIQLSYLIDSLKEGLVEHYHGYQQAVVKLNALYDQSQEREQAYVASQKESDPVTRLMGTQAYFRYREDLLQAEQKARHARTHLARIAGDGAVDGLGLLIRPEASRLALIQSNASAVAQAPKKGAPLGAAAPLSPSRASGLILPLAGDVNATAAPRKSPVPLTRPGMLMDDVVIPPRS